MKRQLTATLALIMMTSGAFAAGPKFELKRPEEKKAAPEGKLNYTKVGESKVETGRMMKAATVAVPLGVNTSSLQAFSRPDMKFDIQVNETVAKGQAKSTKVETVRGDALLEQIIETNKKLAAEPAGKVIPARIKGAQLLVKAAAMVGETLKTTAEPNEKISDEQIRATNAAGMKMLKDMHNAIENPPDVTPGDAASEKAYNDYLTSLDNYNSYMEFMLKTSATKRAFHQIYMELDTFDAGARTRQAECEG